MEKKNKLKNRVFSGLLALTLAGCKPIIVKAEEALVQEEVQVEYKNNEIFDDNTFLSEEYINYLKENDIEVVNGNIKVETVEQFISIRDYYANYLKNNENVIEYLNLKDRDIMYEDGYSSFDSLGYIAYNLFLANENMLSDNLKQELIDKGVVIIPNDDYEIASSCFEFITDIAYYNKNSINDCANDIISFKSIIFNGQIRKVYNMIENDLTELLNIANKDETNNLNLLGDKYLMCFYDSGLDDDFCFAKLDTMSKEYLGYYFIPIRESLKNKYNYWLDLALLIDNPTKPSDLTNEIKTNVIPSTNVKVK